VARPCRRHTLGRLLRCVTRENPARPGRRSAFRGPAAFHHGCLPLLLRRQGLVDRSADFREKHRPATKDQLPPQVVRSHTANRDMSPFVQPPDLAKLEACVSRTLAVSHVHRTVPAYPRPRHEGLLVTNGGTGETEHRRTQTTMNCLSRRRRPDATFRRVTKSYGSPDARCSWMLVVPSCRLSNESRCASVYRRLYRHITMNDSRHRSS
jgi:hypothetical protein